MKRSLAATVRGWLEAGESVALATVVRVEGSAPSRPGACMAVSRSGQVAGALSGGCVDGAVCEEAQQVLASGRPRRLCYRASETEDFEVGLACGGTLEVYLEPMLPLHRRALELLETGRPFGLATELGGAHLLADPAGALEGERRLADILMPLFPGPAAVLSQREGRAVFCAVFAPPPTLTIVGAVQVAAALARLAQVLGFRTRVVDPRRAFATRARFPEVDELTLAWPQDVLHAGALGPDDYIVILSHDPKLDLPALEIALGSRAAYIGLIGARSTQAERRQALAAAGFDAQALARIHGPVGLDLGGREPEEIALAILAEIVAVRYGRSGGMLSRP